MSSACASSTFACSSTRSSVRPGLVGESGFAPKLLNGVTQVACAQLRHPVLVEAMVVDECAERKGRCALCRRYVPEDRSALVKACMVLEEDVCEPIIEARALSVALYAAPKLVDDLDFELALVATGEERSDLLTDTINEPCFTRCLPEWQIPSSSASITRFTANERRRQTCSIRFCSGDLPSICGQRISPGRRQSISESIFCLLRNPVKFEDSCIYCREGTLEFLLCSAASNLARADPVLPIVIG